MEKKKAKLENLIPMFRTKNKRVRYYDKFCAPRRSVLDIIYTFYYAKIVSASSLLIT